MNIQLTSYEVGAAVRVGGLRQYEASKKGYKHKYGYKGLGWDINIEGALGEMAAAKALNVYWDGSVNTWKANDLEGIQVRTRSKHEYELIIRKDDDFNTLWVLVTGNNGSYIVRGWIHGKDAKKKEWLQAHGDRDLSYFVPHEALKPIEEFPVVQLKKRQQHE